VWYNSIVKWVLSSPIHGLLRGNMMLITIKGRRSGKEYTLPVNYVRSDSVFLVTSYRLRTWWRNLRGRAAVTLHVRGQKSKGMGEAVTAEKEVTKHLLDYLEKVPKQAKYFDVGVDSYGKPNVEDVIRAARDRVGVRIRVEHSGE